MRRPRVRFTVRWLMLAIAATAMALWGDLLWRRHVTYQEGAAINAFHAREFREAYEKRSLNVFAIHHGPVFAATPELRLKWAEYHDALARQYARAARHPWEALPPAPAPPETFPPADYDHE